METFNTHRGTYMPWAIDKYSDNPFTITCLENGSAFDLTSYTLTLEIFPDWGMTAAKTLTEGSGITNGGAAGTIAIALSKAVASIRLSRPDYKYRLSYVVGTETFTMFYGPLTNKPESVSSPSATSLSATINMGGSNVAASITMTSVTSAMIATALGAQTANTFYAGPSSGASAVPAFRTLVAGDVPDISATYETKSSKVSTVSPSATLYPNNDAVINAILKFTGYRYSHSVSINNTGNPSALTNDQVEISLTSSNFSFSDAMTNGEDIIFTKSDGITKLNHWIESYNATTQTATIWVKVTGVSALSTGTIYMYYGKTGSTSESSWANTMQRFEASRSGGTTNYLIRFDEGTGTTVANTGSTGGNLTISGTAPTWNSTNVYGFTGARPVFNGTNNVISIPGLLDAYPTNFEISFSVIFDVITGGPRVFNKQNRRDDGVGNDYGDSFFFYCHPTGNKLTVQTRNAASASFTLIQTSYAAVVGTLYKVSIIKKGDIIGMYINGVLIGRSRWYGNNGTSDAFKIGAESNYLTGANELFFAGKINDFRYTDYTSGEEPRLPQIEAEHSLVRFVQKNKRTKFAKTRKLISTNYPTGTVANYSAEPFGMFDNSKYKLWYSHGDGVLRYREALTSDGLAAAADQLIYGSGTGGEAGGVYRHSLIKEGSTLYMYYAVGNTGPIYVVESSDGGVTWTNKQTALAKPGAGFGSPGLVNTGVLKVGSTFYMLVEAYTGGTTPTWEIGLATSSSVTGPFTMSGSNPRTALQRSVNGSCGGPSILHDGTNFHIIHHGNVNGDVSTQDYTWYASSADLVTFTVDTNAVGKIADELLAFDQFADANISTDGTSVFLDYAGMDNRTPFFGSILRATFAGTLTQLVTDLSVTIAARQTL